MLRIRSAVRVCFGLAILLVATTVPLAVPRAAALGLVFDVVADSADSVDANLNDPACATLGGVCTLRAAIQQANFEPGADTINVPAGTYTLSLIGFDDNSASGDLDITDEVFLVGAGSGLTIVNGPVGWSERIMHLLPPAAEAVEIHGITLTGGNTSGSGGGLLHFNGSLTATDLAVVDNTAGMGGGLFSSINVVGGEFLLIDGLLATNNDAGSGGGISLSAEVGTTSVVENATISDNTATGPGGGAFLQGGIGVGGEQAVLVSKSRIVNNFARDGGGAFGSRFTLRDVVVDGNQAGNTGGGVRSDDLFVLERVAVTNNETLGTSSGSYGGGVYRSGAGGGLIATNVTVSGNKSNNFPGGLILNGVTSSLLTNVTIYNNTEGGGIRTDGKTVEVRNVIVANNMRNGALLNCAAGGMLVSLGNNIEDAGSCGLDISNTDPQLDDLTSEGVHKPVDGSPAIDAVGIGEICPVLDQLEQTRPVDGDGDGDAECDIGAFEKPANQPPAVDAGADVVGVEGSAVVLDAAAIDDGTLAVLWTASALSDVDPGASCAFADPAAADTSVSCTDDGTWTLTLTASDGTNPPVSDTATLVLSNAVPTVEITAPADGASVVLNEVVNLTASIADPGANDTHTCSVDWGDGTIGPGTVSAGSCTASHTYSTQGARTIIVAATDDDTGAGIDQVTIVVGQDPSPVVDAGPDLEVEEGTPQDLDGTVTDNGSVTVTWDATAGPGVDAGATCTFVDQSAVDTSVSCTDDGNWTLTLTADDGVNPPVSDATNLTVSNAVPVVTITAPADGDTVVTDVLVILTATFVDPGSNDTQSCDVDWGDGVSSAGTISAGSCTASHTYTSDGPSTIVVSVTDDDGDTGTDEITITVQANGPPSVDAGADLVGSEGSQVSLDGTVSDPDGDSFTVAWTAGAGSGVDAGATCTFVDQSAVDTSVSCTDDGTLTLTLTADDGVNPPVSDATTLTVSNAVPVVNITAPADGATVVLNGVSNLTAGFTDAGANDTHTCMVAWGDGATTNGSVVESAGSGTCTASHTYPSQGAKTITVSVTDDDGSTGSDQIGINVSACTILGTSVGETLVGTSGADIICGQGGNDTIRGLGGNDLLIGGAGNDVLSGGDGQDELRGGTGNDDLFGLAGDDNLDGERGSDQLFGGPGDDDLFGGLGSDLLQGNFGADELFGGEGTDTLSGGPGSDRLQGDSGADLLSGGEGTDTLSGGPGIDEMFGQAGSDLMEGGSGIDELNGGAGNDELHGGPEGGNTLNGSTGNDFCSFGPPPGDIRINCERP